MKIKRFAVAAITAAVFLSAGGRALADEVVVPQEGVAAGGEESFVYTIVRHDTLWDISKRFLKNPLKWPKIWKINPYIKNPDLIYPGNVVKILPDGSLVIIGKKVDVDKLPVVSIAPDGEKTQVLEPEPEPKAPEPKAPVPTMASDAMQRTGFISKEELDASGAVVASKEKRIYMAEGDRIFLSLKDAGGANVGDRFTIFRIGPVVRHPVTNKKIGNLYDTLGYATVTGNDSVVEAKIDNSYKEIEAGDRLMPYASPVKEIEITKTEAEASGVIVSSLEGRENLGAGDIAYIDIGSSNGVKDGNVMRIFRKDKKVADPMNKRHKIQLPPIELGTLIVFKAGEKTSSCVVLNSVQTIVKGDLVSTLQ